MRKRLDGDVHYSSAIASKSMCGASRRRIERIKLRSGIIAVINVVFICVRDQVRASKSSRAESICFALETFYA